PQDIAHIPHPRIGTVGALDAYKVDIELLEAIAREHPDWHLVLVGPVDYSETGDAENVRKLGQLPNVHFLGPKPREEVPAYVHAFDVAIIPYRESPYNAASFPLKFWEFLATGKPVVASGLPSLEPYRHLVTLVSSPEAFVRGIQDALEHGAESREVRVAESKRHTWESRLNVIEKLVRS
ncbi:MAG: glycosyltransferase, partial [bacterium]|nr:glycosyltransferase [bacterium]